MVEIETSRHAEIGAAIERAAKALPAPYSITIDLEKDAGTISLLIPALGDYENGVVLHEWNADSFGGQIDEAIDYALDHHRQITGLPSKEDSTNHENTDV